MFILQSLHIAIDLGGLGVTITYSQSSFRGVIRRGTRFSVLGDFQKARSIGFVFMLKITKILSPIYEFGRFIFRCVTLILITESQCGAVVSPWLLGLGDRSIIITE
ncbi:hypothetical protein OROHE_014783 [Orobanche hederae]